MFSDYKHKSINSADTIVFYSHYKTNLREGRMISPTGDRYVQELVLATKTKGKLKIQSKLPGMFMPMLDKKGLR